MGLIWMALIGLLAGALAKLIMPGKDPGGLVVTALLGIAGAFVGGFLLRAIGGEGGPAGLIGATIGAILLLIGYRAVQGRGVRA